ncbi:MAG: O-antigen ligase family protein [Deltaproteobacteria bacterium]|nr:O-antigen ligase family protein [Deltaproteobacteria bacterium]
MKLLSWQSSARRILEKNHVYLIVYSAFLLGFFISPSIHWHNNFFYAFVVFPYLLTLQKSKIKLLLHSKIWVLSMAFAIYLCLTLLWAENVGEDGPVYYLRRPIYLFVFLSLTIELVQRYPKFVDRLFISLCWVGAITGIISILSLYPSLSFERDRLSHMAGQLHNPIECGGVYGMLVLVAYFGVLKRKVLNHKWIYVGLLLVSIVSVVLTQSRGPLSALVIAVVAGAVLTLDKKALGAVVLIILGLVILVNSGNFGRRIFEKGWSHRFELAEETLKRAQPSLIFGKGISTDTRFTLKDGKTRGDGHNAYLGTILYGGLVGLLVLLVLIIIAFRESLRSFFHTKNITYFALLLFAAIAIITGEDKLTTHPDSLWMFFWLPLALLAGEEIQRANMLPICAVNTGH